MAESIRVFENSLRDYLINVQQDAYNDAVKIEYRYSNLKFYMDPKKNQIPHFYVSLGISEACYMISPVQKISGSIGRNEEKYIIMWASRTNINGELRKHWAYLMKALALELEDADENEKQIIIINSEETQQILDEDAAQVASEIITGTGAQIGKAAEKSDDEDEENE